MKKYTGGKNQNFNDWERPGYKNRDYSKYKIANDEVTSLPVAPPVQIQPQVAMPEEKKLSVTAAVFVPGQAFKPVVAEPVVEQAPEPQPVQEEKVVESRMSKCLNEYVEHYDTEVTAFENAIADLRVLRASNAPIPLDMLKTQIENLRICEAFDLKKQEVLS